MTDDAFDLLLEEARGGVSVVGVRGRQGLGIVFIGTPWSTFVVDVDGMRAYHGRVVDEPSRVALAHASDDDVVLLWQHELTRSPLLEQQHDIPQLGLLLRMVGQAAELAAARAIGEVLGCAFDGVPVVSLRSLLDNCVVALDAQPAKLGVVSVIVAEDDAGPRLLIVRGYYGSSIDTLRGGDWIVEGDGPLRKLTVEELLHAFVRHRELRWRDRLSLGDMRGLLDDERAPASMRHVLTQIVEASA